MVERARSPKQTRLRSAGRRRNRLADGDSAEMMPLDRCRELLGCEACGLSDEEIHLIRRHAEARRTSSSTRTSNTDPPSLDPMGRALQLLDRDDGSKLTAMIGALLYIRVSTKERLRI